MRKLLRFLKDYKKEVILGPLFKLTEAVFELIVPLVMIQMIDVGVKNGDQAYVLKMGGVLLLLGITGLACALICQYFASVASQGTGTALRNALFAQINRFSHEEIDTFGTATLITRLTSDVNQLQLAVAMLIRLVIRAPFLAMGAMVMAMFLDLKLSLVMMIATPLIALVLYLVMKRCIPFYQTIQKKLDRIALIGIENLEGARVIRSFSKQQYESNRFAAASQDMADGTVHIGKISALLNPLTYMIMNSGIVAILWFGGMRVQIGDMTAGQIVAFVNYMTQSLLALIVVANLVVVFTKASASAARVNEILDMEISIKERPELPQQDQACKGAPKIAFKNVSFAYGGTKETALTQLSFEIQPGETVGIIGGTGSGKSTLIQLIPRLYEATEGEVLIDGKNVKDFGLTNLRKSIGVVPQKAVLFSGTIRENMKWGNEKATDQQIKAALDIAQASEFVEKLPEKYDTFITQGGKNLSGGQKQRLTIGRALVGNPEILILDDSASALDFATDAALRQAIHESSQERTLIIVSQRASAIKQADRIIVLDDGQIVGIGTHGALLESCRVYQEICLSQLSAEEAEK